MKRIKVLIVDDQKLFAESMKIVLEGDDTGQMDVVGIAYNGKDAIQLVESEEPHVVLMDIRMPVMNGVEATKRIHEKYPETKILILTTFEEDELVESALGSGAAGYVLKEVDPEELIESVKAVHSGFLLVSPSVGARLLQKAATGSHEDPAKTQAVSRIRRSFPRISKREAEVLFYIWRSLDNHEIAREMCLAERTVKNYITSIYDKLKVADRIHCVRLLNERLESHASGP